MTVQLRVAAQETRAECGGCRRGGALPLSMRRGRTLFFSGRRGSARRFGGLWGGGIHG
jgi:hypothetical protein